MKLALTTSITLVVLASAMFGAGTIAFFSDTEKSTGNTIVDGTLDITIDGNSLPFKAWNIMPGWSDSETHGVRNIGSLDGEVCITAENFLETETGYNGDYKEPPEQGTDMTPEEFAKILFITVYADTNKNHNYENEEEIYDGPVYDMVTDIFELNSGKRIECKFVAYLPTDLDDPTTQNVNEDDNLYQADGVSFDIVFHATQKITID